MARSTIVAVATGLLIFAGILLNVSHVSNAPTIRRVLSASDAPIKKYKLTEQAQEWCEPSKFPPLDYHGCNPDDYVHKIPFMAGLTNGLKMMLLMVIGTFETNRCFFVSEEHNHLLLREDKSQELQTFIGRYFEPIGLPKDDPIVTRAEAEGRVITTKWRDYWDSSEKRRMHGNLHNITSLNYMNIESTILKKVMLRRMWRLLPQVRDDSCTSLEGHGLEDEYMAFSVRRGDKDTEGFEFTKPEDYIVAAEQARDRHFGGQMPRIFVATDDCAVMGELRQLRPSWFFTSECDRTDDNTHGFVLSEMKKWTLAQTDEHYRKFFVELLGLAGAKFYIGVSYTNVAWWAAYMRQYRWSHQFLDIPDKPVYDTLNVW
jgi:predicted nuclease of predicted toxin-antitoxin system